MKTHIKYDHVCYLCGFPVIFDQVEFMVKGNDTVTLIDQHAYTNVVLEKLMWYPGRLSGKHIRFIRSAFEQMCEEFADTAETSVDLLQRTEEDQIDSLCVTSEISVRMALRQYIDSKVGLEVYSAWLQSTWADSRSVHKTEIKICVADHPELYGWLYKALGENT